MSKDVRSSFRNLTGNQNFIDKGISATIYGPFIWKDKKCALKQILYSPGILTLKMKEEIIRQVNRCKELDNPHVVKVFEMWFRPPALNVLMEYAEGKSLDKIIHPADPSPPFELKIVPNWALQMADGMRYLHEKDIVHRNLKASNGLYSVSVINC